MKFIKQLGIILLISFLGELLKVLIKLPIPASIYGLLLMLVALKTKVIKLEQVRESSNFLIEIMPLMFIPAAVGLMESWNTLSNILLPIIIITIVTTIIVMAVTGKTTEILLNIGKRSK